MKMSNKLFELIENYVEVKVVVGVAAVTKALNEQGTYLAGIPNVDTDEFCAIVKDACAAENALQAYLEEHQL